MTIVKPWGDLSYAKVLVVGHDPNLKRTSTIAEYCFFADYYFKEKPQKRSELKKYELAEALFNYINYLTSTRFSFDEFYITNLCNKQLKLVCQGGVNYIPKEEAENGLKEIKDILKNSEIKVILAMSEQVNYWLQELNFYSSTGSFLKNAKPMDKHRVNGCYKPTGKSPFLEICGNQYIAEGGCPLFPILHVKQWPLRGVLVQAYEDKLTNCKNQVCRL